MHFGAGGERKEIAWSPPDLLGATAGRFLWRVHSQMRTAPIPSDIAGRANIVARHESVVAHNASAVADDDSGVARN
jgi:hypothetical protein